MLNEYTLSKTVYWRRTLDTDLVQNLLATVAQWAPNQQSRQLSNQGGWQSPIQSWNSLPWMQPWLEDEALWIKEIYAAMGWDSNRVTLGGYWFNINPPAAFNWPHRHPQTRISTVAWLQAPQNSGDLVFDIDWAAQWQGSQDQDHNRTALGITAQKGQQLAWPAQIQHRVTPNLSTDLRVSLAVNWC